MSRFLHKISTIILKNAIFFKHIKVHRKISLLCSTFNYPYHQNAIIQKEKISGLFEYELLNESAGFYLMKEDVFIKTKELINEALCRNRSRNIVYVFDELSNALCSVADMADFVRIMHPDKKFATAADEVCAAIGVLVEQLNTNVSLYEALKNQLSQTNIEASSPNISLDKTDYLVGNLFIRDFEQSGIHLSSEVRTKFVDLSEQIFKLGYEFSKACYQPSTLLKNELPSNLANYFPQKGNHVIISNLYTGTHDRHVREASFKLYFAINAEQEKRLEDILTGRKDIANLIGMKSYGEKALKGSMAASPIVVDDFLCKLSEKLKKRANNDLKILSSVDTNFPSHANIKSWDVTYLIKEYRSNIWKEFSMSEKLLSEYFTLGSCIQSLDDIVQHLYNVSLVVSDMKRGETWHDDVKKIFVFDRKTKKNIGVIYCDFFERTNKPNQDCHFTIRGGRLMDSGDYQTPVVVLALNLEHPSDSSKPVLLSYSQVENLFHEFGHAMHSMLGSTRYQHVTGTRCTTDFAEVPSILMEYFVSDPRIIKLFARHWKTGQPMPDEFIQVLVQSKKQFQALEMQQQVIYSIIDQKFHSEEYSRGNTMQLMKQIHENHSSVPYTPNTAYHLRFSHFVGYGAKYYSYIWSRAVAGLVWKKLFASDPLSGQSGSRWKDEVLKHGGEKEAKLIVESVLGEKIDPDILVNNLNTELN